MFKLNKLFLSLATGMLVIGAYTPANAKGLEPKESATDVEIIEVYAQKRAQNILDVAVAVTAIDGSNIERLQIKDTTQLASAVPNLKITNNAGEGTPPAFNIRGVGMIDYNTSTVSPIAIYSDGIVSGSANNLSINLFDIEHVEVLRGPQGTLFGRNTTGGAVLLMSKQPDAEFGGYLNASVAQYNYRSVDGAINIPLTDTTAMRFAFNQDDYDFTTNNLMKGSPDGGLKQQNIRLMVKSQFDDVTILAKLHQEKWSGKPKPIASNGILKLDGSNINCTPKQAGSSICMDAFGGQVGGKSFWDVRADTADRNHESDSWGASLNTTWHINDNFDLNLIDGVRHLERDHSWDSDGAGNLIEGSMGTDNQLQSHELNIAYHQNGVFWQTGVFYLSEETKQNNSFDLFRDFRSNPQFAPYAAEFYYDNILENSSNAIYSQLDFQVSDTVLTVGLRYTDERTKYHVKADRNTILGDIPNFWDLTGEVADDEWSGKFAITQKLDGHNSVYASFTRGYKSGGYNAGYSTSKPQALDSEYQAEKLNAYEVGSKLHNLITDLQLNFAAFYYEYQDQQVFVNIPDNVVPYHVLKNAGNSKIYGAELEAKYTPANNLQFNFNVGYLPKANIGRYRKNNINVADNRLPFSSKWNISGAVIYETEIAGKLLTSQLGFDYQSDFYFDQNENKYTEQKGYALANGRISYQATNALLLSVWGKNLTNTEYAELRFDSVAALAAITELKGEARRLGVELNYQF